ncbi:MAG TPA: glycosyltransferase family 1 protein [Polyangiaceae bacterium]|nr:glycosyltransferase family 1 protein [Polyangiaceae bacterium]
MSTPTPFSLSLFCYPYRASKDTGRGHDRYVAELVDNTRSETKHVSVSVVDTGFARNTLHGLSKLPGQALDLIRAKADVYHAITPMGGTVAALMQKQPLVVTVHDLVPFHVNDFDNPMKNRAIRQSVRTCVKLAKAIIVPYQVTKDELVSRLGASPSKVHVVNYGVDHQNYFVQPNVQRADKTILFVGSVSRAKGVEVLIQAFALVKAQIPDAKLVIGGKASADQPVLDELVRTLNLRDVTFSGFIAEADLAENYARATVMVFPSLYGFGLSTLEAMACGTPVVGVATLDATEFFADAGVLAKPDDARDLAACLISVLASPEKQREMAQKSVAHAARFSWANTAKGNVKVYEQVLGR